MSAEQDSPAEPRRTAPAGLIVSGLSYLKNAGFGLLALYFAMRDEPWGLATMFAASLLVIAISLLFSYISWSRRTYCVGTADIRVESGVLSRSARSVPYERIQDVSLEQGFLARLFGLVQVSFDTGAGGKDDLMLAYLRMADGEALRQLVRERREDASEPESVGEAAAQDGKLLFAMGPKRIFTYGLFEFSLAAVAVIAGAADQFDFLLPFDFWDLDEWELRLAGPGTWMAGLGLAAQIAGGAIAAATLVFLGIGTGLVRTILREWGFMLERTAKGLRRRRGLLTRTDVVMPVHRVQALLLGTGFIRRHFGWHGLKLVSLAQDSGSTSYAVAPFAQMEEIAPVAAATRFALPGDTTEWRRPSARAHFDAGAIAFAAMGLAAVLAALLSPVAWTALAPIAVGVIAAVRQVFLWRHGRNAIDDTQIYSRRGWLSPRLTIGAREKLQSVEIVQGPLAQRGGYATLRLGLAGGRFTIAKLPAARARYLRGLMLDSMAARDFGELA